MSKLYPDKFIMNFIEHLNTSIANKLNRQTWFIGLYFASLICLTATGASVRMMLASI